MKTKKLDERVTIGGQPTEAEIHELGRHGFRSIVNLRIEGEEDQPLNPADEGEATEQAGLRYMHIPVSTRSLTAEQLDHFRSELQALPSPVYIHCRGGTRAAALAVVHRSVEAGLSGDAALKQIDEMRLDCDAPLRKLIKTYVDSHVEAGD
jgi:uncharacterized protein (TIGR01244 family)